MKVEIRIGSIEGVLMDEGVLNSIPRVGDTVMITGYTRKVIDVVWDFKRIPEVAIMVLDVEAQE